MSGQYLIRFQKKKKKKNHPLNLQTVCKSAQESTALEEKKIDTTSSNALHQLKWWISMAMIHLTYFQIFPPFHTKAHSAYES